MKVELDKLLAAGIIERSNSQWSSPVVPVRKKMAPSESALTIGP